MMMKRYSYVLLCIENLEFSKTFCIFVLAQRNQEAKAKGKRLCFFVY